MRSRSSRYPRGAVAPVWLYVGLAFSSFILSSCAGQRPAARDAYDSPGPCATRYPVVLVHGIALRSDNGLAPYFPGIQERLEAGGCRVAVADVDAWGTIEANAAQLVSAVREACLDFGADKVNIIAHSKGGLDARYAISVLGLADSVASLTTLATPHRGSFWAGFLLSEARWPKELAGSLADAFGTLAGDERARALEAGSQLSIEAMEAFNAAVPDAPGVLYQSYAGVVAPGHPN
ncbi:MAG: hypothetical protein KKB59_12090, partial [Spirochaetes bacterium]|nr:hypothetical protein [Spirochaetota bacterium]